MSAQSRGYTTEDYGTARYALENRALDGTLNGLRTAISNVGASFTVTRVQRLRRLNLIDGDELATTDGEFVKLAGLGVKTAEEAIRLGIASV